MMPKTLALLTADLYRAVAEFESSQFQEQVLTMIHPALSFDSAVWGLFARVGEATETHHLNVFNRPQEMVLEAVDIMHQDTLALAMISEPGRAFAAEIEELPPSSARSGTFVRPRQDAQSYP